MKKIFAILTVILFCQTLIFAQKTVNETDVPQRYSIDFKRLVNNANITPVWTIVDSMVYDATYTNEHGTKMAYRFSPRGTETRYFIDHKYYPQSIMDTVNNHYPKFKITDLYVLNVRNKSTYQARIAKKGGFLFFKKEKNVKLLNFETEGKFIDEIDIK